MFFLGLQMVFKWPYI